MLMPVSMIASVIAIEVSMPAVASAQFVGALTTRVSVAADGTQANGDSGPAAAITPDGRYVAFASSASNLVTGDTNGSVDVFVKDRQTAAIVRVSVASDGTERTGDSGVEGVDLTDDANIIVFTSRAAFVAGDTHACTVPAASGAGPSCPDIYLHNRTSGQTVRISTASGGANADGPSRQPGISGVTGRFVSFASDATNLVASDANGSTDVFQHDRDTSATSRVSVSTAGGEANAASFNPVISGSGETIAFLSDAVPASLGAGADPLPCPATGPCTRAYTRLRATGVTAMVPVPPTSPSHPGRRVVTVTLNGDGALVGATLEPIIPPGDYVAFGGGVLYDLRTGTGSPAIAEIISGDGRHVGGRNDPFNVAAVDEPIVIEDRLAQLTDGHVPGDGARPITAPALSGDGRFLLFTSTASSLVSNDTNGADVFVADRDQDNDGMFSTWEFLFGLDPANGADGALDPDGDGVASTQEFATAGHPTGAHKYYFAEGAENGFMQTRFAAVNIGTVRARVRMHYQSSDSPNIFDFRNFDADTQTIVLPSRPPNNFATLVESDQPLIMNREMIWGQTPSSATYRGSHMESSIPGPSTTWYLAEGATHGRFDLFYLLQNPTDAEANVSVEYLRPAPLPPIVKTYPVAARSRRTIWVDDEGPELAETDVSATISSDRPLVVERAMYYSTPEQSWIAGHDGAGVTAPAPRWFVAEGATGSFFDFYVLIANPGSEDASLKVTHLLSDGGPPIEKIYTAAARSRLTIDVKHEDPRLASAEVSTIVESTSGAPVVVERALWWPSGNWYEAHLSAGATATGTKWGFAGETEHRRSDSDMFLLIANTSSSPGTATIKLLPANVTDFSEVVVPLPANSRVTVQTSAWFPPIPPNGARGSFGGIIEADVPIVVEQANYTNSGGRVWELGSSALATKLQ
jgi:hypothetical protein